MNNIKFENRKSIEQVEESTELAPKFDENGFAKANKELYEAHCTEFDTKRFKQNHPDLYEDFVYSRPSTRLILPK